MSWADYVRERILDPLAMDGSTAHQPVPEELADNLSEGYRHSDGRFEARPFEFVPMDAAGTMSATAEDMAKPTWCSFPKQTWAFSCHTTAKTVAGRARKS